MSGFIYLLSMKKNAVILHTGDNTNVHAFRKCLQCKKNHIEASLPPLFTLSFYNNKSGSCLA